MPHPEQLPEGFLYWPHIRSFPVATAETIVAASIESGEPKSRYELAAEYSAVTIGSDGTDYFFLVNRPTDDPALLGTYACDAYNDLPSEVRPHILEAEYEDTVEGETVTVRCKEGEVPEGVTPTATGLIPSWVAGLPIPETVP